MQAQRKSKKVQFANNKAQLVSRSFPSFAFECSTGADDSASPGKADCDECRAAGTGGGPRQANVPVTREGDEIEAADGAARTR